MQTAILTLHVIVCIFLVILVLLQSGREGMGVIFGGGGDNSVFGASGAGGILVKLTTFLAIIFVCTSLGYNLMVGNFKKEQKTVLDVKFEEVETPAAESGKKPADVKPEAAKPAESAPSAQSSAPAADTKTEMPAAKPADTQAAPEMAKPESAAPAKTETPADAAKAGAAAVNTEASKAADAAADAVKPAGTQAAPEMAKPEAAAPAKAESTPASKDVTPDKVAAQPASPNVQ